jgi:hypothetical protein
LPVLGDLGALAVGPRFVLLSPLSKEDPVPAQRRSLFLVADILFAGGAIGVESVSGAYTNLYGEENITYGMIVTVEEFWR